MNPLVSRILLSGGAVLVLAVAAWFGLDLEQLTPGAAGGTPSERVSADSCPVLELAANDSPGQLRLPAEDVFGQLYQELEVPGSLTVSYNGNLGRYGQLTLSAGGRMFHPNNGSCTTPYDDGPRFIVLDDDNPRQNPVPVPFLAGAESLRSGSTIRDLAGWFTDDTVYMRNSGFDDWFVLQPDSWELEPEPRPAVAPDPGGTVQVAGFNVQNYFTSLGERGARDRQEFTRQHTKLVAALDGLNAHLIALAEIENDVGLTLDRLVSGPDGLSQKSGQDWGWGQGEGFGRGNDDIGLAFLYRRDVLAPVGPVLADGHAIHNRPPLAQRFRDLASETEFTVVMNHLKSRGGCGTFDTDQGSGCWDERRDSQVRQMLDFVDREVAPFASGGILILGDMNAYALEAPIRRIQAAGFTDLLATFVPAQERYTYVFEPGWAGYIDHALADEKLLGNVCGAAVWHINADEPVFMSWSGARFGPDHYAPDPFRSSDHDPVLVGLDFSGGCGR